MCQREGKRTIWELNPQLRFDEKSGFMIQQMAASISDSAFSQITLAFVLISNLRQKITT